MTCPLNTPVAHALACMEEARRLLLEQLSTPGGLNANIAESLDLLDSACAFASDPENKIVTCPSCGSIYSETHDLEQICLCCDHHWTSKPSKP